MSNVSIKFMSSIMVMEIVTLVDTRVQDLHCADITSNSARIEWSIPEDTINYYPLHKYRKFLLDNV